jgi:deoxycytidylate deaminase
MQPIFDGNSTGACDPSCSSSNGDPYKPFKMFGWSPEVFLSDDENYMDMVMLVTRNSKLRQGSMACILVKPREKNATPSMPETELDNCSSTKMLLKKRLYEDTLAVAINQSLYTAMDSDIHAEVAALGSASRRGRITDGATAYITMPPCKKCFSSLFVSGVTRVVARQMPVSAVRVVADAHGIELVALSHDAAKQQMERIHLFVNNHAHQTGSVAMQADEIAEGRKRRREEKQQRWLIKQKNKLNNNTT